MPSELSITIKEALRDGQLRLEGSSDAPALDAQRLLLSVLGTELSWLYARSDEKLPKKQAGRYWDLVEERASGKPLAYLLGVAHFYGREFFVNEDVLIPRPSTEALVEAALKQIMRMSKQMGRPLSIADIGTGSGCIAITLLRQSPGRISKVFATDISAEALNVAKYNAKWHGIDDAQPSPEASTFAKPACQTGRASADKSDFDHSTPSSWPRGEFSRVAGKAIEFLLGDMLEPLDGRAIDLIVSNPPYVPLRELEEAERSPTPETAGLQFEPRVALAGGHNGYKYVEQLKLSSLPALVETVGGRIDFYPPSPKATTL